ncbi:tryptophan-rich sensory protein [Bosea sp. BE125]|uniref:TspO/MBR family protein n=1 Tax=Bosea sp. BE125 TaxID=2817909 RepID=UPI002854F0DF|nr:TspO/MBR family protein [Bosea sp. BE125]MDR6874634.1 tryptophan-rich sensory protein [Bosea sp. BE125]
MTQVRGLAKAARLPHLARMSAPSAPRTHTAAPWRNALIVIVPVVVASIVGSAVTVPQIPGWYAGLAKPVFNPPNWVFGPVWTLLFAMMAYAVYRILRLPAVTPGRVRALAVYHVQLALNLLWSCVFFGLNSPVGGILVIVPLLALILTTIAQFRLLDRLSAGLLWPYAAWVSFATLLNVSIWWLNK